MMMRKSHRLVALAVLFSVTCLAVPASGAGVPWASSTDPTDVPRSHVQDVTTAPFTYNTAKAGTIVWLMRMPYQTYETVGPVTQQFVVRGAKD
jgi:hypothetical protein